MSDLYGDSTDQELADEIALLRSKIKTVAGGDVARVVAGEGRRMEMSGPNLAKLEAMLKDACSERDRRAGNPRHLQYCGIQVGFPYGGDF